MSEASTQSIFLSRVRLARRPSIGALAPFLVGREADIAGSLTAVTWSLFADHPDRRRDFLWREDDAGMMLVLSERPPVDHHNLFELETKPFAPALTSGDRLSFLLRVNATVAARDRATGESKRSDVVMAVLHDIPSGERAEARRDAVLREGRAWLKRQSESAGFSLVAEDVAADGYDLMVVRGQGKNALRLGVLDLSRRLTVTDAPLLLARLTAGFGRGKAFGSAYADQAGHMSPACRG